MSQRQGKEVTLLQNIFHKLHMGCCMNMMNNVTTGWCLSRRQLGGRYQAAINLESCRTGIHLVNFCTASVPCANLTSCMMVECSIVSSCAEKKTYGAGESSRGSSRDTAQDDRTTEWPCLCAHTMTWSSALPSHARRPASFLCFLHSQMLASSNPAHSMCVRRTQSPGPLLCHPCPLPSFLPPPPPRPSNACLLQPRASACPVLSFQTLSAPHHAPLPAWRNWCPVWTSHQHPHTLSVALYHLPTGRLFRLLQARTPAGDPGPSSDQHLRTSFRSPGSCITFTLP